MIMVSGVQVIVIYKMFLCADQTRFISLRGEEMAGITTKLLYQGCDTFLQTGLKKKDQINEDLLKLINENTDKGLLSVRWEKTATRNVLKYDVTNMTALSEYVRQTMTQDKYFGIISQFQKILEYCASLGLPMDNFLINDPKNVFYSVEKQKLYVAYLPLLNHTYKCTNTAKFLMKVNKNANFTVSNGAVMQKYNYFLEEYVNNSKNKSGFISPTQLYKMLHEVLMLPDMNEAEQPQPAAAEKPAVVDDDSDHTILVSRRRVSECPAFLRDENNREIPIDHFPFTIGRRAGNDLALTDKGTVSKVHAVISYENGTFYVEDKESANGTFLNSYAENGERIIKEKLTSGDVIYICDLPFVFNVNDTDSATVIIGDKGADAKKAPQQKANMKKLAYIINSSSKERIPVFVYPFTCAELSGMIVGRDNTKNRHSIFIENISCQSLSVEGDDVAVGDRISVFSGCNFLYHGIGYTFFEES